MENENVKKNSEELQRAYRTSYLIAGFIKQELTEEERDELDEWIIESKENMHLFGELTDEENIASSIAAFEKLDAEEGWRQTNEKLKQRLKRNKRKTIPAWKWAAAAGIIIAIALTFLFIKFSAEAKKDKIAAIKSDDLLPATDKAVLSLENGQVINFSKDIADTQIGVGARLFSEKGELVYSKGLSNQDTVFHTLTVPKKGHFKLTLADGTKVWLNAASSIKFPLAFNGSERRVFVTGETYFEVAKDKIKPFRVVSDNMMIEAIGTQFNVNAYSDESAKKATLIEGAIRVSTPGQNATLVPGEQANIQGVSIKKVQVETTDIIAWKNNQFKFRNTPLEVIMHQIEKWYDAEIVYTDKINVHLNATIDRDVPVSEILKLLEATRHVKFKIEGSKIIVSK